MLAKFVLAAFPQKEIQKVLACKYWHSKIRVTADLDRSLPHSFFGRRNWSVLLIICQYPKTCCSLQACGLMQAFWQMLQCLNQQRDYQAIKCNCVVTPIETPLLQCQKSLQDLQAPDMLVLFDGQQLVQSHC